MLLMVTGGLTTSAEMPLSMALNPQWLRDAVWNKSEALSSSVSLKPQQHQQIITRVTGSPETPNKSPDIQQGNKAERAQRNSKHPVLGESHS